MGVSSIRTWDKMAALQVSGKVDFSPIVTHVLPFEDFAKGFDLMHNGQCGKVTLLP